jgi:hypothetical protein
MERRGLITIDQDILLDELPEFSHCKAKVYPICEPLKIRNITKSNAAPYAIAKGLQKDLHTYLKRFFQFSLIGEPLAKAHIEELGRRSPIGTFASGDFSAATDNVKIELTKLCFERLLHHLRHFCGMSPKYISSVRKVLYEHEIHYPTGYGEDLDAVIQENGQLMGSVLSFPVLCMINVCTYWDSVEPDVEDFKKLNVLVNGDDILFRTTEEKYNHWLATLPEAGLFPSPGKNFFHDTYCTVNSELFSIRGSTIKCIPFFNAGMLLGQSKVCRQEGKSKPVHCLHESVIAGALNPSRADARFKYYNKTRLASSSKSADGHQMNYYIPRELGGLGMKLPGLTYLSAERFKQLTDQGADMQPLAPFTIVTGAQRKIAKYLYDSWTTPYLKPPMKPIGLEVDLDRERSGPTYCSTVGLDPSPIGPYQQLRMGTASGFVDIPDQSYRILIPDKYCPMPPWCRPIASLPHDPNWSSPPMDSAELERLKFESKGVRLYRSAKMKVPCHALLSDFTEYKYVGTRWWSEVLNDSLQNCDYLGIPVEARD